MFRRRNKTSDAKVSALKKHTGWLKLTLELFVVFAGVTAGFLLNNWWVNREDKNLENYYYTRFIADLKDNLTNLKKAYSSDSVWLSHADTIYFEYQKGNLSEDNALDAIGCISTLYVIKQRSNTFSEVTNGSKWHIIKNAELVKKLHNYYVNTHNEITIKEEFIMNFYTSIISPILYNGIDFLHPKFIRFNEDIAVKISNLFVFCYANRTERMNDIMGYIEEVENLIAELEQSIN